MGITSWFSGIAKGARQTGSILKANSAKAGFLELLGSGSGKTIEKTLKKPINEASKSFGNTVINAVEKSGVGADGALFADEKAKANLVKQLRNLQEDSIKIAGEGKNIASIFRTNNRYMIDKINNVTGGNANRLFEDAGFKITHPVVGGSGGKAPIGNVIKALENTNPGTGEYIGGWLEGAMSDGTINKNALLLRKGLAIGGGAVIGNAAFGVIGGNDAKPMGTLAGGAGVAALALIR